MTGVELAIADNLNSGALDPVGVAVRRVEISQTGKVFATFSTADGLNRVAVVDLPGTGTGLVKVVADHLFARIMTKVVVG